MWPIPCHLFGDRTDWDSQYSKWGGDLCILCIGPSCPSACLSGPSALSLQVVSLSIISLFLDHPLISCSSNYLLLLSLCQQFSLTLSLPKPFSLIHLRHLHLVKPIALSHWPQGSSHVLRHKSPFSKDLVNLVTLPFSHRHIYPDACLQIECAHDPKLRAQCTKVPLFVPCTCTPSTPCMSMPMPLSSPALWLPPTCRALIPDTPHHHAELSSCIPAVPCCMPPSFSAALVCLSPGRHNAPPMPCCLSFLCHPHASWLHPHLHHVCLSASCLCPLPSRPGSHPSTLHPDHTLIHILVQCADRAHTHHTSTHVLTLHFVTQPCLCPCTSFVWAVSLSMPAFFKIPCRAHVPATFRPHAPSGLLWLNLCRLVPLPVFTYPCHLSTTTVNHSSAHAKTPPCPLLWLHVALSPVASHTRLHPRYVHRHHLSCPDIPSMRLTSASNPLHSNAGQVDMCSHWRPRQNHTDWPILIHTGDSH